VPLFKKTFEQIKGQVLPPPPAIERMMESMGVAPKQKGKARQTLMRSAKHAAFFELAADRLVMPASAVISQHHAGVNQVSAKSETSTAAGHQKIGSGGGNDGGSDHPDIHPAILGLLRDLPKAGSPLSDKRRKSLIAAFTSAVDFIYPEPDEVNA
jgi:hypothetical protein